MEGAPDCGGVLVCNYISGEGITHMNSGRPLVLRKPAGQFNLANFFRAQLYSTMVTLKIGMQILEKENVAIKSLVGHGGLFKTPGVGQRYLAAACNAPVTCMETAGEGGPYGMALLAAYCVYRKTGETLEAFLNDKVFKEAKCTTLEPDPQDQEGFARYVEQFEKLLAVEEIAIASLAE